MNEERQKGENLLKDGCILVDTSGRTRELKEKSVLGVASLRFNYTILLTSSEKKKIFNKLIQNKFTEDRAKAMMHSVKLYYGLKNYILNCPSIYICGEGFNPGFIKEYLKKLMGYLYHDKKINIVPSLTPFFGKKNIADRVAWEVNKNGKKPNLLLIEKHFKELNLI